MKKILLHILILVFLVNCKNKIESGGNSEIIENKEKAETEVNVKIKQENIAEKQIEKANSIIQERNDTEIDSIVRNIFMVAQSPKFIEEKLELNFHTISEDQFLDYKKSYDYKIIKEKLIQEDSARFVLKSDNKVYELNNGFGNSVYPISDYYGYLKPLNTYIIGSGGEGIYEMFLLNKATDSVTSLPIRFADVNSSVPRISPNNKRLICYQSYMYEKETYFSIYEVQNEIVLSYTTFDNKKWSIEDIIWIDNRNIALKVCENFKYESSNREKKCLKMKYLKTEIE